MTSESVKNGNYSRHYIVGIGASAGGLEAIESLFDRMPQDTGMAFVVVQHLSPDYKSLMVELLSKRTSMKVSRAEDGMIVEPNNVYLIPPKKNITIFHGKLLLTDQGESRRPNFPIDIFLESLAEDQTNRSIGIILSGTGSDGMRGIKAIKEKGGMVMVQTPESAKFDGMPRSAISTGIVDFVTDTQDMPDQLLSFIEHPYAKVQDQAPPSLVSDKENMDRLYSLLRKKHKLDFTYYKTNTVVRRVERRMMITRINEFKDYVRYLEDNPHEITNLYRELLIGVTHFFRDPEAFELIGEKYISNLILNVNDNEDIRVWSTGCSTGEETYSLAILFKEKMEQLNKNVNVKIFATDIDSDAIMKAAAGKFSESITANVSTERLQKYFRPVDNGYLINKNIREMVVFAKHDLLNDPPFPNIDLVSCRNLLIYLQPILQSRALELMNYSLRSKGILFLGPSETTGDTSDYFEPLNHKWKIYRSRGKANILDMHKIRNISMDHSEAQYRYDNTNMNMVTTPPSSAYRRERQPDKMLERIVEGLKNEYIPTTLVLNHNMELVYTLGNIEGYFKVPSGRMIFDISKMMSKDLSVPITTGLQKVFTNKEDIKYTNLRTTVNGERVKLNILIKMLPEKQGHEPLAAVFLFDKVPDKDLDIKESDPSNYDMDQIVEQRITDLEQELQLTRENLQATIEELETSNEELQATNEELFASNEELQATNEELHSVNEELHTVNTEYQDKIFELTELNQDIENLMSNTQIGALFLDENLEIRKFTETIKAIFHLIDKDIGRNIEFISDKVLGIDLLDIIKSVQDNNESYENEINTKDGKWYLIKVLPYRVEKDIYSGIIVTIIDISTLKNTQKSLEKNKLWLNDVATLSKIGAWELDINTREMDWTDEVYTIHDLDKNEFKPSIDNLIQLYRKEDRTKLMNALDNTIENGTLFELDLQLDLDVNEKNDRTSKWIRLIGKSDRDNEQGLNRIYGSFQDITDQFALNKELENARMSYKEFYDTINSPTITCENFKDKGIIVSDMNCAAEQFFGTWETDHDNGSGNAHDGNIPPKSFFNLVNLHENGSDIKNMFNTVWETGIPEHIESITVSNSEGTTKQFELHLYRSACGELVSIFHEPSQP
ncbi:chemotaxis protein CheB [Methanosalsum natronophilum]|uniref:chemotaxis protein CheB n=1 Tax=Methanosalsum natronophilum TaxID=768733 RepID=UPI002166F0CD|nr:chemotaxis protein CheB [Methanosalsum natronophilum]MCS3923416.1 two-component system CheB/CheR fusion protein [Methanosalsum natronophilum]